jgi:hypothetical protein
MNHLAGKKDKYPITVEHIKIRESIVIDEGEGYFMRGTRIDVGSFSFVVIEWAHPNYGYFADAMVWIKSLHMDKWELFPIVEWSKGLTVENLLKDYPSFKPLFEEIGLFEFLKRGKSP